MTHVVLTSFAVTRVIHDGTSDSGTPESESGWPTWEVASPPSACVDPPVAAEPMYTFHWKPDPWRMRVAYIRGR